MNYILADVSVVKLDIKMRREFSGRWAVERSEIYFIL